MVCGKYCPAVIHPFDILRSYVNHRLNSKRHSAYKLHASVWLSEIRHLRILVKIAAYSVTYKISYYAIAVRLYIVCYSIGYLKEMSSVNCFLNSFKEAVSCNINKLLRLFAYLANTMCSCSI